MKIYILLEQGALVICLGNNITTDIVDDIMEVKCDSEFTRVVFKDNGFKSDSDKTNIKETLKIKGIDEFITI
jgi:adenine-specific DNA-methyltransferase